jgi:CRISPR/Cas system CSM-associated protein Csm4 (group 5 of RAMP superfamily)
VAIADKAKKFSNQGSLRISKTCPAYGTRAVVTRPEIAASSSNDMREKTIKEIRKKTIRKRTTAIREIKDSRNPRGQ